jgi:hypothetical protein
MIDDLFPYVGEVILERMINDDPSVVLTELDISEHEFIRAYTQVKIEYPESDIMFDGFSTIDIGLELTDNRIYPIEVKLGKTGLSRSIVNKKLSPCSVSTHRSENRVAGSILAVFNRYYDPQMTSLIDGDRLCARIDGRQLLVTMDWGLIARNRILSSWDKLPPDFNGLEKYLSLESICASYGRDRFNVLVSDLLSNQNYYDVWLGKG